MTQQESIDLINWIEEATHRATTKALRKYTRGALLGFLILLIGLVVVREEDRKRADDAFQARVKVANTQRQAIVKSGTVVAVDSCNQRFKDRVEVRSILTAAAKASEAQYKQGEITKARYDRSKQFYRERLEGLPLPDCRDTVNVLTTDLDEVPPIPKALHPGSPDAKRGQ